MIGIENLKKAVKFGIDLGNQLASALKDKKITWLESLGFIDELTQLPGVIEAGKNIPAEVADLTHDERQELNDYVTAELDIPAEEVESFVAAAIDFASSAYIMVDKIKKLRK